MTVSNNLTCTYTRTDIDQHTQSTQSTRRDKVHV